VECLGCILISSEVATARAGICGHVQYVLANVHLRWLFLVLNRHLRQVHELTLVN